MKDNPESDHCLTFSVHTASSQAITIKIHNNSDTDNEASSATAQGIRSLIAQSYADGYSVQSTSTDR